MRAIRFVFAGAFLAAGAGAAENGEKLGPRDVLWRLRQGNLAFTAGKLSASRATPARRASLVAAQHPLAAILTCADSRVPPEHIFNEGLGGLFVVRVAGVVADPVVTGSVEYAAEHLHVPLVVVMGHTRCGAVKAAIESKAPDKPSPEQANLEAILSLIRPGVPKGAGHGDPWKSAVYGGVEQSMCDLVRQSRILREMGSAGHVGVAGAVYELETGKVIFSDLVSFEHAESAAGGDVPLVKWRPAQVARGH